MSYENPDIIPKEQINNALIWNMTADVVRVLSNELRKYNLQFEVYEYLKNEYCDNNSRECSCPHWMVLHIISITEKLYQPHCYIRLCKRKRVYEIRYEGMVDKNFWINTDNRTQGEGKYIHSYGLTQAASDINIIYQACEIHDYNSKGFKEYYLTLFKRKKNTGE